MSKEVQEYFKKRVTEPEYRNRLNQFVKEAMQEILDWNIGEACDDLTAGVQQADQKSMAEFLGPLAKALIISGTPIIKSHIEEKNLSLQERFGSESLDAWRTAISQPVEIPRDTVKAIVQQPAVKELFVSIIHDSIIGFNKKVNPLAGAMAAFGMDKQIKDFIIPFMDSVTQIATDFMVDDNNKNMFQDFSAKIFDIVIAEKPADYMGMPIESNAEKFADAVSITIQDAKAQEDAKKSAIEIIAKVKAQFGARTVRQYLEDNKIKDPTRDLTEWEKDIICKHLAGNAFSSFMAEEIAKYKGS